MSLITRNPIPEDRAADEVDEHVLESARAHHLTGVLFAAVRAGHLRAEGPVERLLGMEHLRRTHLTDQRIDALVSMSDQLGPDIRIGIAKGIAFSHRFLGDASIRPGSDVDLYFERETSNSLGQIAARLDAAIDAHHIDDLVAARRNFEFALTFRGVRFDVHHDVMNLTVPTHQHQRIWTDHSVPFDIPGLDTTWTLDDELSLLAATTNAARDGLALLRHLHDIRVVMDAQPCWSTITDFADREGWLPIVSNTLEVACELLGRDNPLPPTVLSRKVFRRIVTDDIVLGGKAAAIRMARRQSAVASMTNRHRPELARALAQRIFPPRSVIDARHGRHTVPYPVALYRWREAQRKQISDRLTTATER